MTEITLPEEIMMESVTTMLSEGREVSFIPKGVSMRPFIEGGRDKVIMKKTDCVNVGDIVLARLENGRYILHRVISKSEDFVTLMGDGNLCGTETALTCNVLATVIGIVKPNGRHVKPKKGRLWFRLLPLRRYLLWIYEKVLILHHEN